MRQEAEGGMRHLPPGETPDPEQDPGPRRRSRPLVPLLIFAAFLGFILYQEQPVVRDFIDGIVAPERQRAREACAAAALATVSNREFARIIEPGEMVETQGGWLLRGLVIGEPGSAGSEQRSGFECYLDRDGRVVSSGRTGG